MRRRGVWLAVPLVAMGLADWAGVAQAQEGETKPQEGERRERRRRFDPERMRQMFNERIKERLSATDEEWQVLQPCLTKVMELRRNASTGSMRMLFGRRGRRGGRRGERGRGGQPGGEARPAEARRPQRPEREPSELRQKATALSETLEKKDASAEEIKAKLAALRKARDAARVELAKARKELREIVTQRQEAMLVLMGLLD